MDIKNLLVKYDNKIIFDKLNLLFNDNQINCIVGNGINNQIADNSTEEGRKKNRRTDIKFLLLE